MKKSLLLPILFLLATHWVSAQSSLGVIDILEFPATVRSGDSINFIAVVQNTGNVTIPNGTLISISMAINGDLDSMELVGMDTLTEDLDASDTVEIRTDQTIRITAPQYHIGGVNIIVVWPSANSILTTDSVTRQFYVDYAVGIEENRGNEAFELFPVPVQDKLYLNLESGVELEEVRITDMAGRLLFRTELKEVDVRTLAPGTYIIKAKLRDGQIITRKFVKAG
ncbi:MAG: T9SS type A sorting domain-containing protein [Bacteroidia bacterium]